MRMVIWIIFCTVSIFLCASSTASRLDGNIVPTFYKLNISVKEDLDSYVGQLIIDIKVEKPQLYVSLHYSHPSITITSVTLNNNVECKEGSYDGATEIAKFQCDELITTGSELKILFNGNFETRNKIGFYKITSFRQGKKHIILNTNFLPGYARTAFPCFDEPSFKANFRLVIIKPIGYVAVSNTLASDTEHTSDDFIKTTFHPTPKISTHLVAIYIASIETISQFDTNVDGYKLRIYNELEASPYIRTVQDYSAKVIAKLGAWTSVLYKEMEYTQLSIIILQRFVPEANEFWGLIDFSEKYILDDQNKTSASTLENILILLAHELAIQWFGNYVTPNWWSDVWLNEGLARYLGFHIYSKNLGSDEDEFDMNNKFVGKCLNDEAFFIDGQPTSHPLSRPETQIVTIPEIKAIFENWYYAKGASIIRMISHILGERQFRDGISLYLKRRKYQTANSELLLEDLAEGAKQDKIEFVNKINNWIYKAGFPIVTAVLDESTSEVVLTQKPFNKNVSTEWWIPISYTTSSEKNFTFKCSTWLQPKKSLKISVKNDNWVIFNLQVVGYYRVHYDDNLLYKIITALEGEDIHNIHPLNRAQLIYDLFNLAAIGQTTYNRAFDLANYLRNETDYYPWRAAFTVFSDLLDRVDQETQLLLKNRIEVYMAKALSSTESNGGSGIKHVERLKSTMLQEWACMLGKEECINYAKKEFEKFKSSNRLSDYDKRDLVFCYALKTSDNPFEDAYAIFQSFQGTSSIIEKITILKSLTCISNETILEACMMSLLQYNVISDDQYAQVVLDSLITNDQPEFQFTMKFFGERVSDIINVINPVVFYKAVSKLLGKLVTKKQYEQFCDLTSIIEVSDEDGLKFRDLFEAKTKWIETYGTVIKDKLRSS